MTKWTAPDIASIRGDNSRPLQKIFGSLTEYLRSSATGHSEVIQTFVRNAETTTLTVGTVVYLHEQQGDRATVKRAFNTTDATSAKTLGVVAEAIAPNADGLVTTSGYVEKVDTSGFTAGQTVYLSATAGLFTATKPYAPNHLVYVGVVVRANAGNGILYVRCQNGYELDEIHDVLITSPTAGQTLSYDAVNSLWKNATFSDGGGLTNLNASNLSSGTVPTARISGSYTGITGIGTLTVGSIPVSLLTGTTLPSTIVTSSLTSVGTLTGLTSSGQINVSRGTLGTALNNELTFIKPNATTSNGDSLDTRLIRTTAGTDWATAVWRMGRLVDATRMGFIQFSSFNVQFGSGTTVYGTVDTSGFSGVGSGLTSLNASNLSSGTVASARLSGSYTGITAIGTVASLTVDGANSPSFRLGDWNAGTYSGITGNTGYLLVGANNGDVNVYFRAAGASGTVNLGGAGVDTLKIGNGTMLQIGNTSLGANNTYQCAALPAFGFNAWAGVSSYNFYNASDIRYKANVKQLPLGLNFIKLLNPIEFTYIYPEFGEDSDTPTSTTEGIRLRAGLSAQNVKESLLAVGAGDYNLWALADKDNQNSFQALDYTGFIAPIIKAVQELEQRLTNLETV